MQPTAEAPGYRERRYSCQDGLSLYYRDYGEASATATTVVCLPGLTRNSKDFAVLARRLSMSRRVLCPDFRGRGRSEYDRDWRRYHPRTYVDDVRHLLVANNVHRAVFIGTSMGGIVAAGLAVSAPAMVAGVVLNDVGPVIEPGGLHTIVAYVRDSRRQPDWEAAVRHIKGTFPDLPADSDADWREIAEATYREGDDGRLRVDWDPALVKPLLAARVEDLDLWPLFGALRECPVVTIRGALSAVLGAETLARMKELLPNMTAVTIGEVGHAPSLAEPAATVAIDDLLARV